MDPILILFLILFAVGALLGAGVLGLGIVIASKCTGWKRAIFERIAFIGGLILLVAFGAFVDFVRVMMSSSE